MARVMGDEVNFSFNAVAMEGELNSVDVNFEVPTPDITSFNDAWQNRLASSKKNTTIELRGFMNQTASQMERELLAAMGGGTKSTVLDFTGSGPGASDPEYQCTASGLTGSLVSRVRLSLAPNGVGEVEATIQNSGNTTRATS